MFLQFRRTYYRPRISTLLLAPEMEKITSIQRMCCRRSDTFLGRKLGRHLLALRENRICDPEQPKPDSELRQAAGTQNRVPQQVSPLLLPPRRRRVLLR